MKRILSSLTFLLGLSVALPAIAEKTAIDGIVAVVNDEVITARELNLRVDQYSAQLKKQGTEAPPRDVFARQLLDRMVYERVQQQYARETSVRIDDASVERALARIAENNKLTLETFREQLAKDGIVWERFREDIRNEMTLSRLREREVDSRVVVAEPEVDAFLAAHANASNQEVQVAHILLRAPESATPAQWEKLRDKAESLRARLAAGEDFAKLAAASSDAPDALAGGNLGWRKPDRLPTLYADAIRQLAPGALSQVLRSPAGLHIVKLIDQRGGEASGPVEIQKTHVRHILIKTSDSVSDAEARQRLEQIRERIVKGADFAEQAKRFSADGSAPKGGDLGWIAPGDTVPDFEKAMDALKPGELSAPVQSPFGWHLIRVDERRTEDVANDRRRQQARAALRERKSEEAYEEFVRQLRDKAFVEFRGAYADADLTQPATKAAAQPTAEPAKK
ncbi:peptidylprolyl isomerase [Niveibacterium terrae]|uniref:peptidylprolyl isomerase n=1 Tax=Niveibacterium terrae TaxID=3373598 RepID=UPI003A953078